MCWNLHYHLSYLFWEGTTFIFQKIDTNNNNNDNNTTIVHDTVIDDIENLLPEDVHKADQAILTKLQHETLKEEQSRNEGLTKCPIILCPQQFGGKPGDYTQFISLLRQKGHPIYLVRLSIFQWLSLLKSAFPLASPIHTISCTIILLLTVHHYHC
mmetsp:Transcript_12733/g.18134  ORF Transcript_12733/g.18134 Transcript_12733/m.18134 type:complete len:156 (-) Transcript_12733:8-475(-)